MPLKPKFESWIYQQIFKTINSIGRVSRLQRESYWFNSNIVYNIGALTSKSYAYQVRWWDIETYKNIDFTDGFGTSIILYLLNNEIIHLESDNQSSFWITDKTRQFFDSLIINNNFKKLKFKNNIYNFLKLLTKNLYLLHHCNYNTNKQKQFFTIVVGNNSMEILGLVSILSKQYPFIKLRNSENIKFNNDIESKIQLNLAAKKLNFKNSDLCLLVSTNPRFEAYQLNINLRQRILKGNFKCFSIGSLINLTFTSKFLGSTISVLKSILEGNNFTCQAIKNSKSPILIHNFDFFKRHDIKNLDNFFNNSNTISFNIGNLGPTLFDITKYNFNIYPTLSKTELNNFGLLYFLNITDTIYFKKLINLQLLNYFNNCRSNFQKQKNLFVQGVFPTNDFYYNYNYLPTNKLYENEQTFINVGGLIKKSNQLLSPKNLRSNWQLIQKLFRQFNNRLQIFNNQKLKQISFNSVEALSTKNFISFNNQSTKLLTMVSFYIMEKNKPFNFISKTLKKKAGKIFNTCIKYWLDDFFYGGKDGYTKNSLALAKYSKTSRIESD
jgi:hypothetical protein